MDKIPSLEDFCFDMASKNKVPDKDYPTPYLDDITHKENPFTCRVSLKWLSRALRGDEDWAFTIEERTKGKCDPGRLGRALKQIENLEPLYRPWLHFKLGRTIIMNGRHRLYGLMDSGYTHVEVMCDPHLQFIIESMK